LVVVESIVVVAFAALILSPQDPVEVAFQFAAQSVTACEPVTLRMSFHNSLAEGVRFVPATLRDDYLDLSVTQPDQSAVTPPPSMHGGLLHVGAIDVPPGKTVMREILVNEFYPFRNPGQYKVRVRLNAPIRTDSGGSIESVWHDLTLHVAPRDPKRLETICRDLAKAAAGYGNYEELREAATTLSYIDDPVAVPYLGQVLGYDNFVSEIAVAGLVRIGSPEALKILKSKRDVGREELRIKVRQGIQEIETGVHPQILD